jgi:hypothetical protein
MSETQISNSYCYIEDIKDRMLIQVTDTSYDTALNSAAVEASRIVDTFLKPYTTVPLTGTIDPPIFVFTADIAASVFKRRMFPEDVALEGTLTPDEMQKVTARGWFAQGITKLEQYIKAYFVFSTAFTENGNAVHNPRLYLELFRKGVITGKEARTLMGQANEELVHEYKELCKTITTDENYNIAKTVADTERAYHTKKQRSFAFISSNTRNDKSSMQDGYQVDSEGEYDKGEP